MATYPVELQIVPRKCHPERSSSRILRTAQSKDLHLLLHLPLPV
jgi:hypothetical protein